MKTSQVIRLVYKKDGAQRVGADNIVINDIVVQNDNNIVGENNNEVLSDVDTENTLDIEEGNEIGRTGGRELRSRQISTKQTTEATPRHEDQKLVLDGKAQLKDIIPKRHKGEAIGIPIDVTTSEKSFIEFAFKYDLKIEVQKRNPKLSGSKSFTRYELYKEAQTLREIIQLGGTHGDVFNDYSRGYITFDKAVDGTVEEMMGNKVIANGVWSSPISSITSEQETSGAMACARVSGILSYDDSIRHEFGLVGLDHIEGLSHNQQELLKKAIGGQTLMEFAHSCAGRILIPEPITVREALTSEYAKEWRAAMDEEITNLIKFQCFTRVPKTQALKHGRLVKSKWVFKVKYNSDTTLQRFRARLVAKGFTQVPGTDFYETFSPVFGYTSLRALLAKAANEDLEIHQWDLKNGFIQQDIDVEHMYMQPPEGYSDMMPDGRTPGALHCLRSIYGLKQSSRLLHNRLSKYLKSLGYSQLVSDQCVYVKNKITICTWVDDIVMFCPKGDGNASKIFDAELRKEFEVSPWTAQEAGWILNMRVQKDWKTGTLHLSQEAAIEKLAAKFGLSEAKGVKIPMVPGQVFARPEAEDIIASSEYDYMSAVGALLYISLTTRPDIAYAVGVLSRYMACPSKLHVEAAQRVIGYLQSTKIFGLRYSRSRFVATKWKRTFGVC